MATDEPDWVLEQQAAEQGLADKASRRRRDVPHDTDAERGALGVMLQSISAAEAILDVGLEPEHFYAVAHQRIYAATCAALAAGERPDPVTVAARGAGLDVHDLLGLVVDAPVTANGPAYARRVMHCARLRHAMTEAAGVVELARNGDLDGALAGIQRLAAAQPTDDSGTTWAAVDLAAALDGDGPPPPTLLARDDGLCLLYAGKVHAFNAESESGKSWLACAAVVERIEAGEHVLYLDFEDAAEAIVGRLLALGATRAAILDRLHYIRPDDPIDAVATAALERLLIDHRPTLAIVDGVTEVMVQNGWSITDNDDAARFLLALPRRIARHGAAVVLIDHVPKDKEGQGRYSIGAQHKLAGIDGAAFKLEVTQPFGIGRNGASRITVTKDRPGHIRGAAVEGRFVAEMRVNSLPDGAVHLQLAARSDAPDSTPQVRPTNLMERVSRAIEEHNEAGEEPTRNAVLTEIPGKRNFVADALKRLVDEGYVLTRPGPNRANLHRSARPYRAILDPRSDAFTGTSDTAEWTPDADL